LKKRPVFKDALNSQIKEVFKNMYSSNRFPPRRGRIVAFEPRKPTEGSQDDEILSIPSPDEPEESVEVSGMLSDETGPVRNSPISSEKPLLRLFNLDIWLDDVILLVIILFLISESNFDTIILPVLVFLFLAAFSPGF
jgi:hypothetical protein